MSANLPRPSPRASRSSPAMAVGVAILLLAILALLWMFHDPPRASSGVRPRNAIAEAPGDEHARHAEPTPTLEHGAAFDEVPIMAAGSADDSNIEPRRPHPITPEHERNFRQLNMVAVLNSAMDVGDVDELRRANRQYREEYPEATLLQDGYDLIADCIEHRSASIQAAAQRYWETQVASNLRRYVRRHCLE